MACPSGRVVSHLSFMVVVSLASILVFVGCPNPVAVTSEPYSGPAVAVHYAEPTLQIDSATLNQSLLDVVQRSDGSVQLTLQTSDGRGARILGSRGISVSDLTPGKLVVLEAMGLIPYGLVMRVGSVQYQGNGTCVVVGVAVNVAAAPLSALEVEHVSFEKSFFESSLGKKKVIQLTKTFEISASSTPKALWLIAAGGRIPSAAVS